MKLIMNSECGNVFEMTHEGWKKAKAEAAEMYNGGNPIDECSFWDYYEIIEV